MRTLQLTLSQRKLKKYTRTSPIHFFTHLNKRKLTEITKLIIKSDSEYALPIFIILLDYYKNTILNSCGTKIRFSTIITK